MPRGKKNTNGQATVQSEILDEEGFYCVKGELLWKYRAVDAEFRNIQLALKAKQVDIDRAIQQNPQIAKLFAERQQLANEVGLKGQEMLTVNSEIEKKLGISLKNCGIDDKTGRVYDLTQEGQVPKAPEKKSRKRSAGAAHSS